MKCLISYSQLLKRGKISLFYLHSTSKGTRSPVPPLSHSKEFKYWNFRNWNQAITVPHPQWKCHWESKEPSQERCSSGAERLCLAHTCTLSWAMDSKHLQLALPWGRNAFSSCTSIPADQLWGLGHGKTQARCFCLHYSRHARATETSLSTCPALKTLGKLVGDKDLCSSSWAWGHWQCSPLKGTPLACCYTPGEGGGQNRAVVQ